MAARSRATAASRLPAEPEQDRFGWRRHKLACSGIEMAFPDPHEAACGAKARFHRAGHANARPQMLKKDMQKERPVPVGPRAEKKGLVRHDAATSDQLPPLHQYPLAHAKGRPCAHRDLGTPCLAHHVRRWTSFTRGGDRVGGAEGNRTPDLCSAIAALSHLSYGPDPWEAPFRVSPPDLSSAGEEVAHMEFGAPPRGRKPPHPEAARPIKIPTAPGRGDAPAGPVRARRLRSRRASPGRRTSRAHRR